MDAALLPFKDFLIACFGASASFIGLLFVALSVVLARNDTKLEFTDRRLAESAFTALANVFFISLTALIPGVNIGWVALAVALVGLRSSWRLIVRFINVRKKEKKPSDKEEISWIVTSLAFYLVQIIFAVRLIIDPTNTVSLYVMIGLLLGLFGGGLIRSWELTGIRA